MSETVILKLESVDSRFIRLPKTGERCPVSGLSRSSLSELIASGSVVSKSIKAKPGAKRGIRLIDRESLVRYLQGGEAAPGNAPEATRAASNDAPPAEKGNPRRTVHGEDARAWCVNFMEELQERVSAAMVAGDHDAVIRLFPLVVEASDQVRKWEVYLEGVSSSNSPRL